MRKLYLYVCRCLTVVMMCGVFTTFAQQTVSGKVTSSDDGLALPGVNVLEKGTGNGTVSDNDGNFTISVASNATLVFSFVGYAAQEIVVGSQTSIQVKLQTDVKALSEVVVVGYGSQEKKEITGAVVSLDTRDFNKGNVNDPTQLLQGKVAGLSIYNKGGDPNASAVIRLRGLSTVGSNVSPLIVVDGVLGASLDNIDPNDIATINVLKDGSAAAIYGSRGSSGVILVTTKRGAKKGGGLGVTFNSYVAAASVYKKIPVMTPEQYVANGGNDLGSKTNWQDLVTQTGVSTVQNLAISGGSDNTTFRMSTNLRNVNGVLKNSGFDQTNTRANLTHTGLEGKLKIDLNMAFTTRNSNFSFNEALRYAALYNPTAPVYFPNGNYYQAILFDNFNPVAILNQNSNKGVKKNLNYSAKIDYTVIPNLTLTANYGQQFDNVLNGEYYSINSLFRGYNRHGLARRYTSDKYFTLFESYATYAKSMGNIDLTASGGYSYQEDQFKDLFVELGNFPSDALGYNALQTSGNLVGGIAGSNGTNVTSSASPINKIIAFFGRVSLMFDKGIFFNASVRREGSTKLGSSNQWGTFPAVGAGIDLNKYLRLPTISLLKLRVGYGVTGSLPSLSGLAQDRYTYSFNGGGNVTLTQLGNKDLKWEQKAETNVGVEFGLFGGKLNGTLDVYNRTISDFILNFVPDAVNNPGTTQYKNAGSLNTPGIELSLNYDLQLGEVKWTPGIVVSHYTTTLKSFIIPSQMRADFGAPGQNGTNIIKVDVGEKVGRIWGPVFDHVSKGGTDGANQNTDPAKQGIAAGAPIFKDLNGDGKVDANPANALLATGDFKQLGNGIPTAELGWSNRLSYKNWDMNVFFRASFGHSLVNQFRGFYEPIDPGAINSYNRVITGKAVAGLTTAQYSSLYVEKADFFRLDNMTIGYNFKLSSTGPFKSLRLYASGQNLFVITKYTGIDPDPVLHDLGSSDNGGFLNSAGSFTTMSGVPLPPDVLSPGIDRRNNYFTARTYTFGLNFGL
jgi:TonB-dependent starch-binding outer membrane protein SusC